MPKKTNFDSAYCSAALNMITLKKEINTYSSQKIRMFGDFRARPKNGLLLSSFISLG